MVYVFLADGFEEIEATAPVDILRRCGIDVLTVGVTGKSVTGVHGIKTEADIVPDEIELTEVQAVVLPGGVPGTPNLQKNKAVCDILDFAYKNEILICAICAAPSIIGEMGYLNGKKATCYTGYEKSLKGAECTGAAVVRDSNFITARGAGVALDFGFAVAAAIKGDTAASDIAAKMLCR